MTGGAQRRVCRASGAQGADNRHAGQQVATIYVCPSCAGAANIKQAAARTSFEMRYIRRRQYAWLRRCRNVAITAPVYVRYKWFRNLNVTACVARWMSSRRCGNLVLSGQRIPPVRHGMPRVYVESPNKLAARPVGKWWGGWGRAGAAVAGGA